MVRYSRRPFVEAGRSLRYLPVQARWIHPVLGQRHGAYEERSSNDLETESVTLYANDSARTHLSQCEFVAATEERASIR